MPEIISFGSGEQPLRDWAAKMASILPEELKGGPYDIYMNTLAKEGIYTEGYELSKTNDDTKLWKRRKRPKIKECYANAQMFVIDMFFEKHKEATYYEGLCNNGIMPFDHAWVVFEGKLYDFTLEAGRKYDDSLAEYLGIPFPRVFVAQVCHDTGHHMPVAQHYFAKQLKKHKKKKPR